jgi:rSAM/selenodomain-associated transferase 1
MRRADKSNCAIAVFARAPIAGQAKTRLVPLLGAEGAAELQASLLRLTLAAACHARDADDAIGEITLWCAPDISHSVFTACRDAFGVGLRPQAEGDLGARMLAAFETQRGRLLLIGTDCPVLTPELLSACAHELIAGRDAVFLPAEDGGYGLIGLRRPVPALFRGIAWSTDTVMEETRARLRAAGLGWSEPALIWDVDRPEDVERLLAEGLLPDLRPP